MIGICSSIVIILFLGVIVVVLVERTTGGGRCLVGVGEVIETDLSFLVREEPCAAFDGGCDRNSGVGVKVCLLFGISF